MGWMDGMDGMDGWLAGWMDMDGWMDIDGYGLDMDWIWIGTDWIG